MSTPAISTPITLSINNYTDKDDSRYLARCLTSPKYRLFQVLEVFLHGIDLAHGIIRRNLANRSIYQGTKVLRPRPTSIQSSCVSN